MADEFPYVQKTFDGYTLIAGIRNTYCSSVYESENPTDCSKLAVKFILKNGIPRKVMANEIDINQQIDNEYIMPIRGVIFDVPPEFFCGIVMDKAAGCDLLDMFCETNSPFDERVAVQVAYAGLKALEYLHESGICHRDIKLENFFLMDENRSELDIVLADFGHACRFNKGEKMNDFHIGTLVYSAPEILKEEEYDQSIDIWSLGCVIYSILAARNPFPPPVNDEDPRCIRMCIERIIRGNPKYEGEPWDSVSEEAKDFVKSMIQVDPKKRSSISDLLQHPWIQSYYVEYGRQRERRNRTRIPVPDI